MLFRSVLIASAVIVLSTACVAKKDTILPTKYERRTLVDTYKRCVANATNSRFDTISNPDTIVRDAIGKCVRSKNAMLKEYPKSWRQNLEKKVDEDLYRREIAWVNETRKSKQ
jgi:hypothetical protein